MATLNESVYNPEGQQDPVRGLTLAIRGLRLGGRVQLPDGTLVISQVMNNGPRKERRFVVVPPKGTSSPEQRHQAGVLGHGACKTATAAAMKALGVKTREN